MADGARPPWDFFDRYSHGKSMSRGVLVAGARIQGGWALDSRGIERTMIALTKRIWLCEPPNSGVIIACAVRRALEAALCGATRLPSVSEARVEKNFRYHYRQCDCVKFTNSFGNTLQSIQMFPHHFECDVGDI
jgi:hypothetical protein